MRTITEIMNACYTDNGIIKIPSEKIDKKLFSKVKKHFETHGFKWKGGKTWGFAPLDDKLSAEEALASILEEPEDDLRQKYQFFETPPSLVNDLLLFANCFPSNEQVKILEPSGGRGAIIKAIMERMGDKAEIYTCELWDANREFLSKKFPNVKIIGEDFLQLKGYEDYFDFIIANPPFTKGTDIKHVMKMYECLAYDGCFASMTSTSWLNTNNKANQEFNDFLDRIDAGYNSFNNQEFKGAGTTINTLLVYGQKHDDRQAIKSHLKCIEDLLWHCGVIDINPDKTYEQLCTLEKKYNELATKYCNGDIETNQWNQIQNQAELEVQKLFNNKLEGLFINSDPRGYIFKIDGQAMKQWYADINMITDMGQAAIPAYKFKTVLS